MTKDELRAVVDKVHANWNVNPLPAQVQSIYKVWWGLLAEFDLDAVDGVVDVLIKEDGWAPRAGTVYRRVKFMLSADPAPSVALAWEDYRRLAGKLDSGVWEEEKLHPTLQKCINVIGGYHLHTNSDREHFTQIYTELLNKEYQ